MITNRFLFQRFRTNRWFARHDGGATAVEFALIAPVFILMIGGLFTISMVMHARSTIGTYAREAARGVAVGYMTVSEARLFAETHSTSDLGVAVTATIDPATKGNPADQDVIVTLAISSAEIAKLTPFSKIISGGVSTRVVMRNLLE